MSQERTYEFGPFRLDVRGRLLTREGRAIPLTPKAADLLLALLDAPGRVFTKQELFDKVWEQVAVTESTLTYHISQIRQALNDGADGQPYIENLPKRGYRFVAPVRTVDVDDRPSPAAEFGPLLQEPGATNPPAHTVTTADPSVTSADPMAAGSPAVRRAVWSAVGVASAAVLVVLAMVVAVAVRPASSPPPRIVRYTQLTTDRGDKPPAPLFIDRARVYFQMTRPGSPLPALGSVGVNGGETVPFPDWHDFQMVDLSTARSEFLAIRRPDARGPYELWALPTAGGSPRRIGGVMVDDWGGAWSPDGLQIAFVNDQSLFVVNSDGTSARRLPTPPGVGRPEKPQWSPDGRLLRYTDISPRDRQGPQPTALWEVGTDGTGLRPLLPGWHTPPDECCGKWTPDGKYFVFQTIRSLWNSDFWILREPAGLFDRSPAQPVQLAAGPLSYRTPTPSVDGKRLFAMGVDEHVELIRYDSRVGQFVPYLGGLSAIWVSFSRDAQWVAYVSHPETKLWRMRIDGSEKRQLTFDAFVELHGCSWSPDGHWIAFRGRTPESRTRIYVMPSEGGTPRAITSDDTEQGIPTWSADGNRIAFGDVPEQFGRPTGTEVIHLYDTARHELSDLPGSQGLWTCRWSPDGRYLAALTIEGQKLRLFDFTRGEWRSLDVERINNPNWSRDGKYIYYDTEGGPRSLRRVRIADGQIDQIVSLEGFTPTASWWSGLALDDSPLIVRNLGALEVYALDVEFPR